MQNKNYTQTPNQILEVLYLSDDFTLIQTKALMWLVRETFGKHRDEVEYSLKTLSVVLRKDKAAISRNVLPLVKANVLFIYKNDLGVKVARINPVTSDWKIKFVKSSNLEQAHEKKFDESSNNIEENLSDRQIKFVKSSNIEEENLSDRQIKFDESSTHSIIVKKDKNSSSSISNNNTIEEILTNSLINHNEINNNKSDNTYNYNKIDLSSKQKTLEAINYLQKKFLDNALHNQVQVWICNEITDELLLDKHLLWESFVERVENLCGKGGTYSVGYFKKMLDGIRGALREEIERKKKDDERRKLYEQYYNKPKTEPDSNSKFSIVADYDKIIAEKKAGGMKPEAELKMIKFG